ncbi:MAG: copper-binding protein, partial [Wenzhouxiangellaceae bacterium]
IVSLRAKDGAEAQPEADRPQAAPPIIVDGRIEAVDAEARSATITHGPITETGMPGMTMEFTLAEGVAPETLSTGEEAVLTFKRPDGMTMVLARAETKPVPITVTGTINAISDGMANITHGPIAAIGMPGMTMDFALAEGLDPATLTIGRETVIEMTQGTDFSLTVLGVEEPAR